MKALRIENNELRLSEIPVPKAAGEALVRVIASGICNTDLEIVRGYAGFAGTPGHEFVGVVERCDSRPELAGKRVVGEINAGCGNCDRCRLGDTRHCPRRTVLGIIGRDGAHAEFLTLPAENLFEVPDNVCDTAAVFTEPLAASLGITEQVDIAPETKVAIIGDGKLGLLCALSLSRSSRKVRVIGRHRNKLDIAEKAGVSVMMEADARDLNGNFDVVVEASGSGSGFASAVELVRPRGKIVLKSTFHGTPSWPASRIVVDEITVIGSRCGRFAPALELLADGSFDLALMVTDEFNLSEGIAAFRRAEEPGVLKVLLRMQ